MTSSNAPRYLSTWEGRGSIAWFASTLMWLGVACPQYGTAFVVYFILAILSMAASVGFAYAYDRRWRVTSEAIADGR